MFQSSPTLTGGCNLVDPCLRCQVLGVSILTHPYGRMQLSADGSLGSFHTCFNPHPPLRADATAVINSASPHFIRVSILTHPYGRMQRVYAGY